jgi:hypothetical protein
MRLTRAPLWFQLAVAVALALAIRAMDAWLAPSGAGGDGGPGVQLAFWPLVALVASAIWKGLEIAGKVTLAALKWSVLQLWAFARQIYSAAIGVGKELVKGLRRAWDFLEDTYNRVIKPAWQHFWKWFERARKWLEDVLRPVFKWLERVRKWITDFYAKYVRPILDTIDAARRVLRVLSSLGLDWAKRLDGWLAELQRRIDAPFQFLVGKINEIINLVNRIVTADGLFQRIALIRSLERDLRYVNALWWSSQSTPLSAAEIDRRLTPLKPVTAEQTAVELEALIFQQVGRHAGLAEELSRDILRGVGIE